MTIQNEPIRSSVSHLLVTIIEYVNGNYDEEEGNASEYDRSRRRFHDEEPEEKKEPSLNLDIPVMMEQGDEHSKVISDMIILYIYKLSDIIPIDFKVERINMKNNREIVSTDGSEKRINGSFIINIYKLINGCIRMKHPDLHQAISDAKILPRLQNLFLSQYSNNRLHNEYISMLSFVMESRRGILYEFVRRICLTEITSSDYIIKMVQHYMTSYDSNTQHIHSNTGHILRLCVTIYKVKMSRIDGENSSDSISILLSNDTWMMFEENYLSKKLEYEMDLNTKTKEVGNHNSDANPFEGRGQTIVNSESMNNEEDPWDQFNYISKNDQCNEDDDNDHISKDINQSEEMAETIIEDIDDNEVIEKDADEATQKEKIPTNKTNNRYDKDDDDDDKDDDDCL